MRNGSRPKGLIGATRVFLVEGSGGVCLAAGLFYGYSDVRTLPSSLWEGKLGLSLVYLFNENFGVFWFCRSDLW